jgi:hypothetical protein
MSRTVLKQTLDVIQNEMGNLAPHRSPELFSKFLIQGYRSLSLDSVPAALFEELLRAKLCLGSLITLYDDLADRPASADPKLLTILYQLNFENFETVYLHLSPRHQEAVNFARHLFRQIHEVLVGLPNFSSLEKILNFDLQQFYSANQYSALLLESPTLHSSLENAHYMHHNMGMIMASTMDLMSLPGFRLEELGAIRSVFMLGQRFGRICNVLVTYERERQENDVSSEIPRGSTAAERLRIRRALIQEQTQLTKQIGNFKNEIRSFSVEAYVGGLEKVRQLHESMEGRI